METALEEETERVRRRRHRPRPLTRPVIAIITTDAEAARETGKRCRRTGRWDMVHVEWRDVRVAPLRIRTYYVLCWPRPGQES